MLDYFKKHGDSSGGTLNDICEIYQIATRKNSISVITLQRNHKVFSADQLLAEIDRHYHEKCKCGLKSAATIEMMAQTLFDSQDKEGGKALLTEERREKVVFRHLYSLDGQSHGQKFIQRKGDGR